MSKKLYPSTLEATEAGKKALVGKYGTHPKFYIYRCPEGYGYTKTLSLQNHNVKVIEGTPNYFLEALKALIGKEPPMEVPPYRAQPMGDEVVTLQDWCATNAKPPWATGLSMIEAAELIVDQALENANIKET